jgi:ABC-2 type transport system permease protein
MVSVTKSLVDALLADPRIAALFQRAMPGSPYVSILGLVWLGFTLLLLAGYAVVQVSRWAIQDQQGRVELLLSAPVSRSRVVMERAVEFALASLIIVLASYVGVAAEIPASGIGVGAGRVFMAALLLWPFALAFGGLGVAVVSRWPRIAWPFLAAFAVVEYFLGDLAPIFKAPDWVANLSVFHLYGNPLAGTASWTPALWMTLVFLAGFGAALALMRQRDVASA